MCVPGLAATGIMSGSGNLHCDDERDTSVSPCMLCGLEGLEKPPPHLVDGRLAAVLGQQVHLVEGHNELVACDLANHKTLGGLRLDAWGRELTWNRGALERTFGDIDHQQHDVDDLRAANNGADEGGVARAADTVTTSSTTTYMRTSRRMCTAAWRSPARAGAGPQRRTRSLWTRDGGSGGLNGRDRGRV